MRIWLPSMNRDTRVLPAMFRSVTSAGASGRGSSREPPYNVTTSVVATRSSCGWTAVDDNAVRRRRCVEAGRRPCCTPTASRGDSRRRSTHKEPPMRAPIALALVSLAALSGAARARTLESADYLKIRSAGDARISPDGAGIAYTVTTNDGPGRPARQLFVLTVADGRSSRIGGNEPASDPEWSPDGQWLAYDGTTDGKKGLVVAHADG